MSELSHLFEQALQDRSVSLDEFLAEHAEHAEELDQASDRRAVLTELASLDIAKCWERHSQQAIVLAQPVEPQELPDDSRFASGFEAGPFLHAEDYARRYPELAGVPLALIEAEYRARCRWASRPEPDEFLKRFPDRREELSSKLQSIDAEPAGAAEQAGSDNSPTDQSGADQAGAERSVSESEQPASDQAASPADVETIISGRPEDAPTHYSDGNEDRGDRGATTPVPAPEPVLLRFGDYEVLSEIARGGMGVVYRARQVGLNRIVAVKMILQGQLASPDDIQRFRSEAEAAARLEHPGIVPVHEVGEVDGQHYFSMGFVDGESLAVKLKQGPLAPRDAASLIRDVAAAIEYAHQHGVVHRDLKPGNILINSAGQPRVTDFGLAKTVEGDSGLTASGQILGTPGYMPPEQASGEIHDVGPLADVYSLGAVLYCLLTGRPPFQSARAIETLRQVVETPPVSPRLLNPSVDRDLETICLKCLEKDRKHRFGSAEEMREELQRYLDGEPIRSRRVGPFTRAWRWCRRKPLAAALAVSVVVLSAAILLAVSLARSAAESRELARVQNQFEQTLDMATATSEWLKESEALAVELEELARRHSSETPQARSRIHDAFATLIRRKLRRPKMDTGQAAEIQASIDLLHARAPGLTEPLQQMLQQRLADWLTDFDLRRPFENKSGLATVDSGSSADGTADPADGTADSRDGTADPANGLAGAADGTADPRDARSTAADTGSTSGDPGSTPAETAASGVSLDSPREIFDPKLIRVSSNALQPAGDAKTVARAGSAISSSLAGGDLRYITAPLIETRVECHSDVRLEAVFGPDWESGHEIGLALHSGGEEGYDFVVKVVSSASRTGLNADEVEFKSIRAVRSEGGPFVAEIRRNGVPLLRRKLSLEAIPSGPLRLRIGSVQGQLEFQINARPPIHYRDPFPPGRQRAGVFALRWPAGVSLQALTGEHRRRPEAASGLEFGDELFAEEDFAAAAGQFRRQMVAAEESRFRRESRYKLGLCLLELNRNAEAEETLSSLVSEGDDDWAALAGVQLWLAALRKDAPAEADGVFELLRSRYSFEQLAALMPARVRDEIIERYMRPFASIGNILKFDSNRVRNMERAASVDRLLSHDGRGHFHNQMELVRVYRFTGDWDKALEAIEPLIERSRNTVSVRHYCRVLRFSGQPRQALEEINAVISGRVPVAGGNKGDLSAFLIDRARVHYALDNPEAVEADVRRVVERGLADPQRLEPHEHSLAALMLGFLLEARGHPQAARETWSDAYHATRHLYESLPSGYNTSLVAVQILGSLSGELQDEDAQHFMRLVLGNSRNSLLSMASSLVTRQTVAEAMRQMWRTERGRRGAREFAFETISLGERIRLPVLLIGQTFFRLRALNGVVTEKQDQLLWELIALGRQRVLDEGKIKLPQLMQLAMSWKGTSSFVGWGGVAPTLKPDLRCRIAWVLGHRYLRLGQPDTAVDFFETAVRDAPDGSLTGKVATEDLELLRKKKSRLRLKTGLSGHGLRVSVLRDGKTLASLDGQETTEIALEPGAYELLIPDAGDLHVRCDAAVATEKPDPKRSTGSEKKTTAIDRGGQGQQGGEEQGGEEQAGEGQGGEGQAGDGQAGEGQGSEGQGGEGGSGKVPASDAPTGNGAEPGKSTDRPDPAEAAGRSRQNRKASALRLRIRIPTAGTATVEVTSRWAPSPSSSDRALPGLLPEPADLGGTGRWQVVRSGITWEARHPAWSPDGEHVAVSCLDGTVRLFEASGWQPVRILAAHETQPKGLAWSPDSRYLASYDDEGRIYIREAATGRIHTRIGPVEHRIRDLAWHPDSQSLSAAVDYPPGIRHWRLDGTLMGEQSRNSRQHRIDWSPDGERLVTTSDHKRRITVWSADDEREFEIPASRDESWLALTWSPDGRFLAAGSRSTLRLWETDEWTVRRTVSLPADELAWEQNSRYLWSADGGRHALRIYSVPPEPADTSVASGSSTDSDSAANVSDPASTSDPANNRNDDNRDDDGRDDYQEVPTPDVGSEFAISPSGDRVVRGGFSAMRVFSREGQPLAEVPGGAFLNVASLDWSPDDRKLAAAVGRGVALFDMTRSAATGPVARATVYVRSPRGGTNCIRWSPDGRSLAAGDSGGVVQFLSRDGTVTRELELGPFQVRSLDWHPDGRLVACGGDNGRIYLVTPDGKIQKSFGNDQQQVLALAFSPDGAHIAASTSKRQLDVWTSDGTPVDSVDLQDWCRVLDWSASGLAAGSQRLHVLPDVGSNMIRGPRLFPHATSIDWLAESGRLVAAGSDGTLIETTAEGGRRRTLRTGGALLESVSVSRDGKTIAAGTRFGSIQFYDTGSGSPQTVLLIPETGASLTLSATGRLLEEWPEDLSTGQLKQLTWVIETASGEQVPLTAERFYARLRRGRGSLSPTENVRQRPEMAPLEPAGQISDKSILEPSGLVRSRRHPDVFWTVSDSGNPAHLHAINAQGRVLRTYSLTGATNHDWETLTLGAQGRLLIGDTGNHHRRAKRTIYEVAEPDARSPAGAGAISPAPLPVRRQYRFSPPTPEDDYEASFVKDRRLYLINKTRSGPTGLWQLDSETAFTRCCDIPDVHWVTGTALSAGGKQLAVVTYTEILIYDLPESGPIRSLNKPSVRLPFEAPAIESAAFHEDGRLLILSEDGSLSLAAPL